MNPCVLCGGKDFEDRLEKNGYRVRRCRACGLTQLNPLPSDEALRALYEDEAYFESSESDRGYGRYAEQEAEYLATFAEEVRHIQRFMPPPARLLDFGCGYGYFMRAAAEAGFDVWGIDLAERAVEEARRHFPDRVFPGTLDEVTQLEKGSFDVIFASHLIEHIPRPAPFVQDLSEYLRPGGLLVFVTPNCASLLARVSGPRWVSFKIPEHVTYFNPATMRLLLENAGLEAIAIESAYQYYRIPFIAYRLRELLHPLSKLIPPVERTPPLRQRLLRITSGSLRSIARKPA